MGIFGTREVKEIRAREVVEQLCIDGVGQIDAFHDDLAGTTFQSELKTLLAYIEHFANGCSVGERMRILKNPTKGGIEFEFRSKHLRVYAMQRPGRKIVIFCGKKKKADSSDNIAAFRLLKQSFVKSL